MASSRNSKSKTSGLRILWIPGRRKHDRKGQYESTSKHVSYNSTPQKKNQMWSLGGSKAQKNLLESEPDTTLFDGPSVSGLSPLAACSVTAVAATSSKLREEGNHMENNIPNSDAPTTPNSSSSTVLLVSIPNSPEPTVTVTSTKNEANVMPAAKYSSPPITTTVAEIIEPNRFALLSRRDGNEEFDPYDLPTPPKSDTNWRDNHRLNASGDANSSIATIATSSPSPNSEVKSSSEHSATSSPTKKKPSRGHHNGQGDVNSIESVSDTDRIPKQDLDWIDELIQERNANELLRKPKHKKKKHHQSTSAKELDQLDGVPSKNKSTKPGLEEKVVEDDDKLVKCLYFTLMCCECSIS